MSETRECTCHPDETPVPCQHGYALSECLKRKNDRLRVQNAELVEALRYIAWEQKEDDQPHLIARAAIAKVGESNDG